MRGGVWKKDIIVLLPRHVDSDLNQMLLQILYSQSHKGPLQDFVQRDANAERSFKQSQLMYTADLVIQNDYESIPELHKSLARQFPNKLSLSTILRPHWDDYFMMLADLAAHRSNCMKRRVGCILVRNNRVIATGYNGTPRGVRNCNEGGCKRCNDGSSTDANSDNKYITSNRGFGLEECLCLHAEENALLEAGRDRIDISYHHRESASHHGTILYCNTCPCLSCAKKIVQSGVREVVYRLEYAMDDQSRALLAEAGILLRSYAQSGLSSLVILFCAMCNQSSPTTVSYDTCFRNHSYQLKSSTKLCAVWECDTDSITLIGDATLHRSPLGGNVTFQTQPIYQAIQTTPSSLLFCLLSSQYPTPDLKVLNCIPNLKMKFSHSVVIAQTLLISSSVYGQFNFFNQLQNLFSNGLSGGLSDPFTGASIGGSVDPNAGVQGFAQGVPGTGEVSGAATTDGRVFGEANGPDGTFGLVSQPSGQPQQAGVSEDSAPGIESRPANFASGSASPGGVSGSLGGAGASAEGAATPEGVSGSLQAPGGLGGLSGSVTPGGLQGSLSGPFGSISSGDAGAQGATDASSTGGTLSAPGGLGTVTGGAGANGAGGSVSSPWGSVSGGVGAGGPFGQISSPFGGGLSFGQPQPAAANGPSGTSGPSASFGPFSASKEANSGGASFNPLNVASQVKDTATNKFNTAAQSVAQAATGAKSSLTKPSTAGPSQSSVGGAGAASKASIKPAATAGAKPQVSKPSSVSTGGPKPSGGAKPSKGSKSGGGLKKRGLSTQSIAGRINVEHNAAAHVGLIQQN
ncbi:hypothetical protein MIR68_003315 [Amoeboaphelidium protococcarum]|nr:hypothetical protein MIR68_003315 [Amoeboaphelidium protococcarum]